MKKLAKMILATVMAIAMSAGAMAQEATAITPIPLIARPEIRLMRSLDETAFAFAYWNASVFHITPMPGRSAEINRAVAAIRAENPLNLPTIVVNPEPVPGTTYSFAERSAARQVLGADLEQMRIQGVGFNRDGLGVFMASIATDADREAVLELSPISAITFLEAQSVNSPTPLPPAGFVAGGRYTPLPSGSSPPVITGANWVRRSNYENWSTFTVSAVRNWNGVTGEAGVLTVGHGFQDGQPVFAGNNGGRIGVANVQLGNNIDVTFVRLDYPSQFPSGYLRGGNRVSRLTSMTAFDYGRAVTNHAPAGTTVGQIVLTQYIFQMTTGGRLNRFENGFVTTNSARLGNSGSPVMTGRTTLAGYVISAAGTRTTSENWSYSVILPISEVIAATGFHPAF